MDLSITLGFIAKSVTPYSKESDIERIQRTAIMLKEYGFSYFDYLVPQTENWVDDAFRFREFTEKAGVSVHQSHAPIYRNRPDVSRKEVQNSYLLAVDAAAAIGAKYLVIHADEYRLDKGEIYDSKKIVNNQIDLFSPVAERADKKGIKIACENVTQNRDEIRSRCSCTVQELLSIIEGLNGTAKISPENPVGCCWDFGHAQMWYGNDSSEALKKIVPHLLCTHVHDNRMRDDHQPPFTGKIDWQKQMRILNNAGYKGNISLELHYGRFPEHVLPFYLYFCRAAGEELIRIATGK